MNEKLFRNCLFIISIFLAFTNLKAQNTSVYFNADSLRATVKILASDGLKGRGNFTASLEKAAVFINDEFKKAGLKYFDENLSYLYPFIISDKLEAYERVSLNGKVLKLKEYLFKTNFLLVPTLNTNDFKVISLANVEKANLPDTINNNIDVLTQPILFIIPSHQKDNFSFLLKNKKLIHEPVHTMLVIVSDELKPEIVVSSKPEIRKKTLFNVVGVLPGKTLQNEVVLITSHYDHIGIDKNFSDSIFNGANDNASGTAAMIAMAKDFAVRNNNERTIVFIAFAGEEIGLKGSIYMSALFDNKKIKAMFNLEMLGKPGAEGEGALIMTGPTESNLLKIMNRYCKQIKIIGDRNEAEKLYQRSDNFPFAYKGVVAHTFMCFLPDDENYHKSSDEISTLNFENMSKLVNGLLPGIDAVVSGLETPKK